MSLLFTIESKIVKPYVETLLISPFREIWERDTNAGKFTAIDEFTYIEFMTSVKKSNPYRGYTPEERARRLAVDIMKHELYEPDELVKKGMEVLVEFQQTASPTYTYYMSAKKENRAALFINERTARLKGRTLLSAHQCAPRHTERHH
jgi:hypothetical protein